MKDWLFQVVFNDGLFRIIYRQVTRNLQFVYYNHYYKMMIFFSNNLKQLFFQLTDRYRPSVEVRMEVTNDCFSLAVSCIVLERINILCQRVFCRLK